MKTMLTDKVVIVTGAGQGMGEATAKLAAERGAKVVVADFNEETAHKVVEDIRSTGGEAVASITDVSDAKAVEAMVQLAVSTFGRLDAAINNAAKSPDGKPIAEMDPAEFEAVLKVDLTGTALCLKYEIAQMLAQGDGGAIVNISSAIALKPGFSSPAYTSAKHGVIGLTKAVSKDYGKQGIRVNSVAPGSVDTVMLAGYLENLGIDPQQYANDTTTVGRFAQPEEVAEGSLWLISDAASYVNGVVLGVEGGYQDA